MIVDLNLICDVFILFISDKKLSLICDVSSPGYQEKFYFNPGDTGFKVI